PVSTKIGSHDIDVIVDRARLAQLVIGDSYLPVVDLELIQRKRAGLQSPLLVLDDACGIPDALLVANQLQRGPIQLETFDPQFVMQERKQRRRNKQSLDLSKWPSGVELGILGDHSMFHAKCQRNETDPHRPEKDITTELLPQLRFDLRTIVV